MPLKIPREGEVNGSLQYVKNVNILFWLVLHIFPLPNFSQRRKFKNMQAEALSKYFKISCIQIMNIEGATFIQEQLNLDRSLFQGLQLKIRNLMFIAFSDSSFSKKDIYWCFIRCFDILICLFKELFKKLFCILNSLKYFD